MRVYFLHFDIHIYSSEIVRPFVSHFGVSLYEGLLFAVSLEYVLSPLKQHPSVVETTNSPQYTRLTKICMTYPLSMPTLNKQSVVKSS
jgi:hypothetical protein